MRGPQCHLHAKECLSWECSSWMHRPLHRPRQFLKAFESGPCLLPSPFPDTGGPDMTARTDTGHLVRQLWASPHVPQTAQAVPVCFWLRTLLSSQQAGVPAAGRGPQGQAPPAAWGLCPCGSCCHICGSGGGVQRSPQLRLHSPSLGPSLQVGARLEGQLGWLSSSPSSCTKAVCEEAGGS